MPRRGYGFKKVDKIARSLGTPKDHARRIEAGLLYVVSDEVSSGHTWTAGADLLDKANNLLLLDTLDSRDVIRVASERLLHEGHLVADGSAVTTPHFLEAEQYIQSVFRLHGWRIRSLAETKQHLAGLKTGQAEAYELAMR
ncbi:MAG: helix-hairpin-helix domain-containing protein [Pirellulaceae bacterium]